MKSLIGLLLMGVIWSLPTQADTQIVTLSVPDMTCAACPITIKAALTRVTGVEKAEVSYPRREAVVTFDDEKTTVGSLTEATANVGYPSHAKGRKEQP